MTLDLPLSQVLLEKDYTMRKLKLYTNITAEIIKNTLLQFSTIRRWHERRSFLEHQDINYVITRYVDRVFDYYNQVLYKHNRSWHNANVCEIGPGDLLGHVILMFNAGAYSYSYIDCFLRPVSGKYAQSVYKRILERDEIDRSLCNLSRFPNKDSRVNHYTYAIEDIPAHIGNFDIVISHHTLEHVNSVEKALINCFRLLNVGGIMIHRVDLGAHDICTSPYLHPLDFLKISNRLWHLMGSRRGYTNRVRADGYEDVLKKLGVLYQITVAERYNSDVCAIPKLQPKKIDIVAWNH